uniref:CACTA en-spm transposon protein n=1 Tax=Angiostrongylus cantonensis TaxID=6313 RepID=A0A0K0DPI6_ANGCA
MLVHEMYYAAVSIVDPLMEKGHGPKKRSGWKEVRSRQLRIAHQTDLSALFDVEVVFTEYKSYDFSNGDLEPACEGTALPSLYKTSCGVCSVTFNRIGKVSSFRIMRPPELCSEYSRSVVQRKIKVCFKGLGIHGRPFGVFVGVKSFLG